MRLQTLLAVSPLFKTSSEIDAAPIGTYLAALPFTARSTTAPYTETLAVTTIAGLKTVWANSGASSVGAFGMCERDIDGVKSLVANSGRWYANGFSDGAFRCILFRRAYSRSAPDGLYTPTTKAQWLVKASATALTATTTPPSGGPDADTLFTVINDRHIPDHSIAKHATQFAAFGSLI